MTIKLQASQRLAAAQDVSPGDVLSHLMKDLLGHTGKFQLQNTETQSATGLIRSSEIQLNAKNTKQLAEIMARNPGLTLTLLIPGKVDVELMLHE